MSEQWSPCMGYLERYIWLDTPFNLHKLLTNVIKENKLMALEDLNVSGMVKNRKLSRAISDLEWRSFRTILEAKPEIYGRETTPTYKQLSLF